MLALAGYGSESEASDSGGEERQPVVKKVDNVAPARVGITSTATSAGVLDDGDAFEMDTYEPVYEKPSEGALEDIVKPKDWERELADKQRRKLEKKAKKMHKKEKKKDKKKSKEEPGSAGKSNAQLGDAAGKPKKKAQISLFGALGNLANADSDSEDEPTPQPGPSQPSSRNGLLGLLPTPKSEKKLGGGGKQQLLLPPSLRTAKNNAPLKPTPAIRPAPATTTTAVKRALAPGSDSESEGEETDFFGFSSKEPDTKIARIDDSTTQVPLMSSSGLADSVGPSKPSADEFVHPSEMYNMANDEGEGAESSGTISNAEAHRMIMERESSFGGRSLGDAVNNIVDVSVDDALGPNVHAQLLKNLTAKAHAKSAMAPLPKATNVRDARARSKHQITYLAQMAVSREEALQEQWAENRHSKRASAQKYGF